MKLFVIESILASPFSVRAIEMLIFTRFDAVIPEVTGDTYVFGKAQSPINTDGLKIITKSPKGLIEL